MGKMKGGTGTVNGGGTASPSMGKELLGNGMPKASKSVNKTAQGSTGGKGFLTGGKK